MEAFTNVVGIAVTCIAMLLIIAGVIALGFMTYYTVQDLRGGKEKSNKPSSRHTVKRHTSKNPSVTVLQDGRAAHVFIDHGREYATVTLDSDTPLTDSDVECIVKDIKKFKAEKENENG